MIQALVNTLIVLPYTVLTRRVFPAVMYGLSILRGHRHPLWSWTDGTATLRPRVVLFVHFDRRGAVQRHVREYLAALHAAGCSVLFVSNSERLRPEAVAAIKPLCAGILIRKNIGYDFGALREGLEHFNLPRDNTEMLILANDSVYGPVSPLEPLLARVDFHQADIWGATDSWQHRYHLQSFFLIVGAQAMRQQAWRKFWSKVRPVSDKNWVIRSYEIGFTQFMLRAGLRCTALWPYSTLIQEDYVGVDLLAEQDSRTAGRDPLQDRRLAQALRVRASFATRRPLNATSDLWKSLLRRGFPFIKRELLRDNPGQIADLVDWRSEVSALGPAWVEIIELDLKTALRDSAP